MDGADVAPGTFVHAIISVVLYCNSKRSAFAFQHLKRFFSSSKQALYFGEPGSWNRANTASSVRQEVGGARNARERIIPIHIERVKLPAAVVPLLVVVFFIELASCVL